MQSHIRATTRSASHHLNLLRSIKPFIPQADFRMAVQALVIPRLVYGSTTLVGIPSSKLAPLRVTLNNAARLITGSNRRDHITPKLKSLNLLPYEARIHLKIACLTHKALHHNTPVYLADKLEISGRSRSTRGASSLLLKPPPKF